MHFHWASQNKIHGFDGMFITHPGWEPLDDFSLYNQNPFFERGFHTYTQYHVCGLTQSLVYVLHDHFSLLVLQKIPEPVVGFIVTVVKFGCTWVEEWLRYIIVE